MAEFDIVIIGGGHNGLIAGSYLAKAGLRVVIFERRLEYGGGLSTEECTLPGFYHNLHSYFHDTINIMPPYEDLELVRFNARYARPEVTAGLPLRNGRALTFARTIDDTCASIGRFSQRDAATYREVYDAYREFIELVIIPALFTPAVPPTQQMEMLEKSPEGREFLRLGRMSPRDVVDELFECEEVKALILHQLPVPRGILPDYHGVGAVIPLVISMVEHSQLCLGGSHVLGHALGKAFVTFGGTLHDRSHVQRIIVENGAARGIVLEDGAEVRADKAVISAVDIHQTFNVFLQPEHLDEATRRWVGRYKLDEFSLFSVHLALAEPPRHRAAAFDSNVDRAFRLNIGLETPADFDTILAQVRAGEVPTKPALFCSVPTLFDRSQAPPGKHTALIWQLAPYHLRDGGAERWDAIKEEFTDWCLEAWREYAPNLTDRVILARVAYSPLDIERKLINMRHGGVFMGRMSFDQLDYFRPSPELSQHRTPIKNLYLCGACCHPGGGIIGSPGGNAATIILEDLGLAQ
ncbi:MAG: NAD(P)/FAD-dependent oxidoreductase [Candidatus Tectomicrobia bacterium]|nr:NAD(P)/FAD-dependent oxidoreductase [Candidatus Tectomicrobia bacterium]